MKSRAMALLALLACAAQAQETFRGDAARQGVTADAAPRQFHRVKWTFPTGGRVVSKAKPSSGRLAWALYTGRASIARGSPPRTMSIGRFPGATSRFSGLIPIWL